MSITSMYPVLATRSVETTAAFYRTHFGFVTTFSSEWYVSLRVASWELAVVQHDHPTIPQLYRDRLASGMLLNVEVSDVDAVHDRLVAAGVRLVRPLSTEAFGQRHAIFAGPDDVLIDIISPVPPSEAFALQFSSDALDEVRGIA